MDIVPSICLSSLAGAIFFFTGGRLSTRLPRGGDGRELDAERAARALAEAEASAAAGARDEAARAALEAERALGEERARAAAMARASEAERAARAHEGQRAAAEIARLGDENARLRAHGAAAASQLAELTSRAAAGGSAAEAEKRAAGLAAEVEMARAELGRAQGASARRGAEIAEAEARARHAAEAAARGREAQIRKEIERAQAERSAALAQLDAAREALAAAEARAAAADRLRAENAALLEAKAALDRERGQMPDLAEVQRRTLELTMRARVLEQRGEEMDRARAENTELRARLEALTHAEHEAADLRRRVGELEAQGFARRLEDPSPPSRPPPDGAGLSTVLERELGRLVDREEGCRMAVLADPRGLLIAASAGASYPHEVAAASSLTTYASDRLRELMPLGAPASLELYDENGLCVRTRWFRYGEECFLVSTVGVVDPNDPEAAHLRARLGELIGGP